MNHQEDQRVEVDSSDEEVDQPEQEINPDDHVGIGRSYECMFCKRGFTTAQALGGHMNIHRKDRGKNRPPNSSSKSHIEESNYAASPRIYHPIFSSYPPQYLTAHEAQFHYRMYFPSTSDATRFSYDQNIIHNNMMMSTHSREQFSHRVISSPCGEDLRMGLSLQFGSSYGKDCMDQNESTRVGKHEEDGLDLELRLGHDP